MSTNNKKLAEISKILDSKNKNETKETQTLAKLHAFGEYARSHISKKDDDEFKGLVSEIIRKLDKVQG